MHRKASRVPSILLAAVILAAAVSGGVWSRRDRSADWQRALVLRGGLLLESGEGEEALQVFSSLISRFGDEPAGYAGAARACGLMGRRADARALLERGIGETGSAELERLLEGLGEEAAAVTSEPVPAAPVQLPAGVAWVLEPYLEANEIRPVTDLGAGQGYVYNHLSAVSIGGKWGLIDFQGRLVLEAQHFDLYRCFCREDGPYVASEYLLDENFQLTGEMHEVHGAQGEFYGLGQDGALYYLDNGVLEAASLPLTGEILPVWEIQVEHELEWTLSGRQGYLLDGALLTGMDYDSARPFGGTLAAVEQDGRWGYLDRGGDLVIPMTYEPVLAGIVFEETEGYVAVRRNGRMGLLDTEGREVLPIAFEEVRPVYQGRAWVKQHGKWGIVQIADGEAQEG